MWQQLHQNGLITLQAWQRFNGIVSGDAYTKWQSQDGSYVSQCCGY
jgi:hypothetical protein